MAKELYEAVLWYKPWNVDGKCHSEMGSRADMLALAEMWRKKYSSAYSVSVQAMPILEIESCDGKSDATVTS